MDLTPTERVVLEEWDRFTGKLSELMGKIPERWVVFKDGTAVSDHEDEDEALEAAVKKFPEGGFIVAQVVKQKTAIVLHSE